MNANIDLLKNDLEATIANYAERRVHNRRMSESAVIIIASLAAVTTVLISLTNVWEFLARAFNTLAIITSALIGVVSAREVHLSHRKLWVLYTEKWIMMQILYDDLRHLIAEGQPSQAEVNSLYARFHEIKSSFNEDWKVLKEKE